MSGPWSPDALLEMMAVQNRSPSIIFAAPPRPHTDDMVQMLDDLGVDQDPLGLRDLDTMTFTWEHVLR